VRLTLQNADILVVDDFLPPAIFAALSNDVERGKYHSVHARHWDKAWRLWDGNPLRGPGIYFDPNCTRRVTEAIYPTSTTVDRFFDSVRELVASYPEITGREGVDWDAIFLSPWLYPVGSGLSLHSDGGKYSGAFTYFVHPRWRVSWGGELLLMQDATASAAVQSSTASQDRRPPSGATESLWLSDDNNVYAESAGIATCVFPWPNRIALIGPARPHMIRRVDSNAGTHVRTSLAGFFLRPL
jgi:hypothetical protein